MITVLEYVWLDSNNNCRSKTKVMQNTHDVSVTNVTNWNYDGSSTGQASGKDSEVILKPIAIYKDPFRYNLKNSYIVLCETYLPSGVPHPDNTRSRALNIFNQAEASEPWFGIEQEFFMMKSSDKRPLGFPNTGFPQPQGEYYCSNGTGKCFGREIAEDVLNYCIYAEVPITGLNFEVAPGQCEFQVRGEGIEAADNLIIFRYILVRTAEYYNVIIDFHPKPVGGDWNGSGCHTNYSTKRMRMDGGISEIYNTIDKLKDKHEEHIKIYGSDNDKRLTGYHETADISTFSYGVADRGCSIRIPRFTERDGKGYLEDRRPASNMDPYLVTSKIVQTDLGL